jgi:hypothetical protein
MSAVELDLQYAVYTEMVDLLHANWKPHPGQVTIGAAYFQQLYHSIFVQCGRKFGKTEIAIYFLWRIAKTFPGVPCYYIAPLQNQAREIVWADPRLKTFGPAEWLQPGSKGINESEMRLRLTNESFIKVDGSDNFNKYRGPKYKICVYEEFKDHRPEFRKAMTPNASVLNGIDLYIGSPPDRDCDYTVIAEEHKTDPDKFFYRAPTWQNPVISRQWLFKEKSRLYLRGEGDVWEREYAARYVKGGASKIFPMLKGSMKKPHNELMNKIYRDRRKLHWYIWSDPAGATCFAVLFVAINPYTKKIYVLDEIYEKDQAEMTVNRIGKRILSKREELYDNPDIWMLGYDEAETWFSNEWIENFPEEEGLQPSHKHLNDKEHGLGLIKDIMLSGLLEVSDRCKWFYWELDNYIKDKNGRIPKKNDHLLDDFRYILGAEGYTLQKEIEIIKERDPDYRGSTIEQDFPELGNGFQSTNWEEYNG